jgi:prevent-host-death family protein
MVPLATPFIMAIIMYMKRVSVADARNHLPALIHEAETEPVEIVRRGKPVAVLVSRADFDRLPPRPSFFESMMKWRERYQDELDDTEWLPQRDASPGRDSPRW